MINENNLLPIKTQYQVPLELHSCHTAIVDGYVIEGHVSVKEINRLLVERPDVIGIGVPGMPLGSPGMETNSDNYQAYTVMTFDEMGTMEIYASYP